MSPTATDSPTATAPGANRRGGPYTQSAPRATRVRSQRVSATRTAVTHGSAEAPPREPLAVHPASAAGAGLVATAAATGLTTLLDGAAGWWAVGAGAAATTWVSALALLLRRHGVRGLVLNAGSGLLGVAGYGMAVTRIEHWHRPSGSWFGDTWRDVAAGSAPAAVTAAGVLTLVVTVWVAAAVAALAALAVRGSLLALVPGVGLVVLAALTCAPAWWVAPLLVAASVTYLAMRKPLSGSALRPLAGRALVGVLCMLTAAVLTLAMPGRPTAEPTAVAAQEISAPSPLVWVAPWQNGAARPVFSVEGSQGPLRWATLDRYDGTAWRSGGVFALTGPRVELSGERASNVREVNASISEVALPGPWLPSPGEPQRVDGGVVLLDRETGDLASGPTGPPAQYRVSATAPTSQEGVLRRASQRPRTPENVHGGDPTSAVFGSQAAAVTSGAASDYDRLQALAQWCRLQVPHDPTAVPGQSITVLEQVATGARPATADQVVGAYALMARSLGYPARVVVGFAPGESGEVRSTDVVAWPEVYLDGVGWQPFYPVTLPGVDADVEIVRNAVDIVPASPEPVARQPVPVRRTPDQVAPHPQRAPVLSVAVGLAATSLLALAVVLVVRRVRRARRRTPAEQLLDRWNTLQRNLTRTLGPQVRAMTADQLVAAVQARAGADAGASAQALADAVTCVLYGGHDVDASEVAAAARRADAVRRAVGRGGRS